MPSLNFPKPLWFILGIICLGVFAVGLVILVGGYAWWALASVAILMGILGWFACVALAAGYSVWGG